MTKSEKIAFIILAIIVVILSFICVYLYINCCGVKSQLLQMVERIEELERISRPLIFTNGG